MRGVKDFAQAWAFRDQVAIRKIGPRLETGLRSHPTPFLWLKFDPILTGLIIFRLNLLMVQWEVRVCNAWFTAIFPAQPSMPSGRVQ